MNGGGRGDRNAARISYPKNNSSGNKAAAELIRIRKIHSRTEQRIVEGLDLRLGHERRREYETLA